MSGSTLAPPITLVQYPGLTPETTLSPPCAKVHMALRFKGLDYKVQNVTSPSQIKRYNPRGRVPVLIVGKETLVDSTDIVTALDQHFPDPPLEPPEAGARAAAKILEDWADEVLYFYGLYLRFAIPENFERIRRHVFSKLPAPARWIAPFAARRELIGRARGQGVGLKGEKVVLREVGECYSAIVDLLSASPFLVGQQLTRADIAVAAVLDQQRNALLTPRLAAAIERFPELTRWLDRVHEKAPSAA